METEADPACGFERPREKSLGNERSRTVYNIARNKYRIVDQLSLSRRLYPVIGTHREYDGIDAQTV